MSIVKNGTEAPKPDGSARDYEVLALLARFVEVGVRGRVDPKELAQFEQVSSSDPDYTKQKQG